MKRAHFLNIISIMFFFASCSKAKLENPPEKLDANLRKMDGGININSVSQGEYNLLGYGYDITGKLYSEENASDATVIDVNRFVQDYPDRINISNVTSGSYAAYYGASAEEYIKDVNSKETFGLNTSSGPNETPENMLFTTNFSSTNENQSNYTYNARYSYATFESRVKIKGIGFTQDADIDLLANYLTPLFINNANHLSAEQLVNRYGTHILLGISLGGRLIYDFKGSVLKESTVELKKEAIKNGFSLGVEKIFNINLSSDKSREEKITILNETTEKAFSGYFEGGSNGGVSFSSDQFGNTTQSIILAGWQSSINTGNCALVGINRAVALDEFISDPIKKQQVKDVIKNYIISRQILLTPTVVYEYYNGTTNRHAYNLLGDRQLSWSNFSHNAQPFKAYPVPYKEAVALYQFYNPSIDNRVLTTNRFPGFFGYRFDGVICYVYQTQISGSVPIYEFYNPNGGHLYTTNRNTSFAGWSYNGQPFYAFPN